MKIKINLPDVEYLPGIILKIGLPSIVLTLIYIILNTYINSDSFYIIKQTSAMLEHTLMSLTLILGGAFLANTISEQ